MSNKYANVNAVVWKGGSNPEQKIHIFSRIQIISRASPGRLVSHENSKLQLRKPIHAPWPGQEVAVLLIINIQVFVSPRTIWKITKLSFSHLIFQDECELLATLLLYQIDSLQVAHQTADLAHPSRQRAALRYNNLAQLINFLRYLKVFLFYSAVDLLIFGLSRCLDFILVRLIGFASLLVAYRVLTIEIDSDDLLRIVLSIFDVNAFDWMLLW